MPVRTLEVGDELVLEGGVRVAVLAVAGETVFFGVAPAESPKAVASEGPEGRTLLRPGLAALPSAN